MSVEMSTALTEKRITELAQEKAEPEWLLDWRLEAFRAFEAASLPKWDRTNIDFIRFETIEPYRAPAVSGDVTNLPAELQQVVQAVDKDGALLIQVDSGIAYRQLPKELEEQGVIFTSLEEAAREHPDLVREHLGQVIPADEDKLLALHAAFASGGAFVYVPKNVQVKEPLQFYVYSETDGLGLFPHLLIVADEGSEVTFFDNYRSGDADSHIVSQAVEVVAKDNARVTLGTIQGWGDRTVAFHTRRGRIGRDAAVNLTLGELGGQLGRSSNRMFLDGDGSESRALMVFFGDQEQHLDVGLVMTHVGEYTTSDMLTKGVLKDKARGVYRALTDIEDKARNTTAFQRENTLVLSHEARIDAIPGLEIEETEVQAGHAATVGQIDEEELFYLMSRGLPEQAATKLVVDGFFDPILQRIPLETARTALQALIDRKMFR